jgi:periplasmic protein TonB
MARDLFGAVTRPFDGVGARSRFTVPLSIAAHTAAVVTIVVVPLLATDALPDLRGRIEYSVVTPLLPPEPPRPRLIPARAVPQVEVDPNAAPIDVPDTIREETGYEGVTCGDPVVSRCGGLSDIDALGVSNLSHTIAPPPPSPPPAPKGPIPVGGRITVPARTHYAAPVYPAIAQAARVAGLVVIQAVIGIDGAVVDATVLRSVPLLDQAALSAVRQWRYTPTRLNGEPVAVIMTVTVNFELR